MGAIALPPLEAGLKGREGSSKTFPSAETVDWTRPQVAKTKQNLAVSPLHVRLQPKRTFGLQMREVQMRMIWAHGQMTVRQEALEREWTQSCTRQWTRRMAKQCAWKTYLTVKMHNQQPGRPLAMWKWRMSLAKLRM